MLQSAKRFFIIRAAPTAHAPHAIADFADHPVGATKTSIVHLSLLLECCRSNLKVGKGGLPPLFLVMVHLTDLCSKSWRGQATLPYLEVAHRARHIIPLLFLSCATDPQLPPSPSERRS